MKIVNSREFRDNQKSFFEMADQGEQIIVKRGKKQAYVLTPVSEDDMYFTPEMIMRIKAAQQEIQEGRSITFNNVEDLDRFIRSL